MTVTVEFAPFAITYGAGVVLEHRPTHSTIYFAPGDDSAAFLDAFEAMQEAAPDVPCAALLARLWSDYA